jgi:hypothetical protein
MELRASPCPQLTLRFTKEPIARKSFWKAQKKKGK